MPAPVVDQEFVAHLFAFEDGPHADRAYAQLAGLWAACHDQLGMAAPIARLGVTNELPRRRQELPPGDFLAAQQRVDRPDRQAVLRRVGGVLNLSVMMVQPQPERTGIWRPRTNGAGPARLGWIEFAQLWAHATGSGTDALLGQTVLLLARTQTKRNRSAKATAQLGRSLADLLPHDETRETNWWHNGITSAHGLGVWDTHQMRTTGPRELVIVAPPDADQEMSRWVWWDRHSVMPPLAEYLLEAAVLRYHAGVLDDWRAGPGLTDVDHLVREVAATFDQPDLSGRPVLLRSYLDRLQANEVRLTALIERLRRIVDQTGAALRQMPQTWGDPGSMMPNDRSLATWLLGQASAERNHQRSQLANTAHTREIVADELDRSLRAADDHRAVDADAPTQAHQPDDVSRKVFVVHGRDIKVKQIFFSFLQALDLRPQDWELLVNATGSTSPNIVDVVRRAPEIAQATIVLMTPDDIVHLHPDLAGEHDPDHETAVGCQARPNVFLELGMALMAYPERTIVIEVGALRAVGDLGGLNVIRFDGSGRAIAKVVARLRQAGCPVDDSDTDWKDAARFSGLEAFVRAPVGDHNLRR